jgi:hypothetical protein
MTRLLQGCCAVLVASLLPWFVPQASAQPKPAPAVLRVAYIGACADGGSGLSVSRGDGWPPYPR